MPMYVRDIRDVITYNNSESELLLGRDFTDAIGFNLLTRLKPMASVKSRLDYLQQKGKAIKGMSAT